MVERALGRVAMPVATALALVLAGCGSVEPGLRALPTAGGGAARTGASAEGVPAQAASDALNLAAPPQYRVRGTLPDLGGSAAAYELRGGVSRQQAQRLAEALGLPGRVQGVEGEGWSSAEGDRRLQVDPFDGGGWYFSSSEGVVSSVGCAVAEAEATAGAGKDRPADAPTAVPPPSDTYEPCVPVEPPPAADLPSRAEAERTARALFDRAGIALEGATVRVDDFGSQGWGVVFQPVVGGVGVVGLEHSATIGSKGAVSYASGFLVRPDRLGDYPLVGTAEGVERLTASGAGGADRPQLGAPEPAIAPDPDCSQPTVLCDPPLVVEPVVQEITGAELVLLHVAPLCAGDPGVLVPAYRFTLAEGGTTWPVAAVEDRLLEDPAPAGRATDRGSGDGPCGVTKGGTEPGVEPDDPIGGGGGSVVDPGAPTDGGPGTTTEPVEPVPVPAPAPG